MSVITISRQYGSGGDAIARCVAATLGYDVIDKEQMIKAATLAKQGKPVFGPTSTLRFLTSWYRQQDPSFPPNELCAYELPDKLFDKRCADNDTAWRARAHRLSFFQTTIELLWKRGNVVIMGRGAHCALRSAPDVLRVRIVAPISARAHRLVSEEGFSYEEAMDVIVGADSLRARYVYESYQRHWEDESCYDLTLNTERIKQAAATDLIVSAAKELEGVLETQALLADRLWV
jgi:cytidylate kinase